ncbi:hypothetical protein K461DRAFT_321290 [Myriangium duriaei CBS 260.36]|uniref:Zn(2)-C6 fungal-type domain-containing protein n=1 Tax=Myriangium duriaei CBS 260.36 TaxID=1168546 RepID=A0A9P4J4H4_9PEZI|nr:hypothetical protein K461DRAFT_321290 [Myriangium duriaei CBS 260.36]
MASQVTPRSSENDLIGSDAEQPGSTGSPSGGKASLKRARRYGFACTECKERKIKCNGERPVCHSCQRSRRECRWSSKDSATKRRNTGNRLDSPESIRGTQVNGQVPLSDAAAERYSNNTTTTTNQGPGSHVGDADRPYASGTIPRAETAIWFQTGIGEDGTVTFNGPTSRFHAGPIDQSSPTSMNQQTLRSQYALMDSVWIPLIRSKQYIGNTGICTEVGLTLLEIYWAWLHPLHNWVYRPMLVMDLALGGPYCSDFLIMCIFSLVARHLTPQDQVSLHIGHAGQYVQRAKQLLQDELSAPTPQIPTIQGLLILGGAHCAMGKSSEGWLYTGMAFRMMVDIGLHLRTTKLAELERRTPAETETRRRLYNSAFLWDKTLSLALGRPPTLTERPYPTEDILDKYDDYILWQPVHAIEVTESLPQRPGYHTTVFCAFCRIHEITTDMLLLFSDATNHETLPTQIADLDSRLRQWYADIPNAIKIEDTSGLAQSSAPHIVSLNLMYHTLQILLRRPYLSTTTDDTSRDRTLTSSIVHSTAIYAIHALYTRTFPQKLMTYQISYCIFTAATIEVQEVHLAPTDARREAAAVRLAAAVRVLQEEALRNPGSGKSLNTIRRLLSTEQHRARGGRESQRGATPVHGTQAMESAGLVLPGPVQQVQDIGGEGLGDEFLFDPMMLLGGEDFGLTWADTGAGFHPEAFPWTVLDGLQRGTGE